MFGKLLKWIKIPVMDVPDDIAVCEFDCDETECLLGDWRHCERRLKALESQQENMDKGAS